MSLPIHFRPKAEQDVAEAGTWYEEQQPGLGARFLSQLEATLERVVDNPQMYPVVEEDIRSCGLRRFPYILYYRLLDDRIEVLAVLHGSRDPATWRERA
jgi:toxin ParE1/3/4